MGSPSTHQGIVWSRLYNGISNWWHPYFVTNL